jgi:hypothetical protein
MKAERKIGIVLFSISFAYVLCAGGVLFLYINTHPGASVPRSISVPILCLLILTIAGGAFAANRLARKNAKAETLEEGHLRRLRAIKGSKVGLIVLGLILLNDFRMLLQGTIQVGLAIPGLVIILLITAVTWTSLRRLQRIEAANQDPNQKRSQ